MEEDTENKTESKEETTTKEVEPTEDSGDDSE